MENTKKGKRGLIILIAVIAGVLIAVGVVLFILLTGGKKGYGSISVSEIVGDVTIEKDGDIYKAYPDMHLTDGFSMMTAIKSYSRMNLDDEKFIKLEEESRAKFEAIGSGGRSTYINLEYGTISNEITRPLNDGEDYMVTTPNAVLSVRGTLFVVTTRKDNEGKPVTEVYTFGGAVATHRILPDGTQVNETVMVNAGYKTIIKMDEKTTYYVEEVYEEVGDNVDPIEIKDIDTDVLVAVYDAAVNGHEVCFSNEEILEELEERNVDLSEYDSYHTGKPLSVKGPAVASDPGAETTSHNGETGAPSEASHSENTSSDNETSGSEDTTASSADSDGGDETASPPEDNDGDDDETTLPPETTTSQENTAEPADTKEPDDTTASGSTTTSVTQPVDDDTTTTPSETTGSTTTTTMPAGTPTYPVNGNAGTTSTTTTPATTVTPTVPEESTTPESSDDPEETTTPESSEPESSESENPDPDPENCDHEKHKISSIDYVYTCGGTGYFSGTYVCEECGGDKCYVKLQSSEPTFDPNENTYTYSVHYAEILEDELTYTDKYITITESGMVYECTHPEELCEKIVKEEANCEHGNITQIYCNCCDNYIGNETDDGQKLSHYYVLRSSDPVTADESSDSDGFTSVDAFYVNLECKNCGDTYAYELGKPDPVRTVQDPEDEYFVLNTYNYSFTYNSQSFSGSFQWSEMMNEYADRIVETCSLCHEEYLTGEIEEEKTEPTCAEAGLYLYKCPNCHGTIDSYEPPATGEHTFTNNRSDYEEVWTHIDGTHNMSFKVYSTCTVCHQRLRYDRGLWDDVSPDTGMNGSLGTYSNITYRLPDDTLITTSYTCKHDGTKTEEVISDATCSETGSKKVTCDLCGKTTTETIPKTENHSYSGNYGDYEFTTEHIANTYSFSYHVTTLCATCGERVEYTSGTATPNQNPGGYEFTYTDAMGRSRTETFSCPHDDTTHTDVDEPTCTLSGLRHTICDLCGADVDEPEIIPATHHYMTDSNIPNYSPDNGIWTKYSNGNLKLEIYYQCLDCGEVIIVETLYTNAANGGIEYTAAGPSALEGYYSYTDSYNHTFTLSDSEYNSMQTSPVG